MSIEISWQVEDGYVNHGSRSYEIDTEELLECGTVDDAMKLIEDCTHLEFQNKVTWCFSNYDEFKAEVEKLFAEVEKAEAE